MISDGWWMVAFSEGLEMFDLFSCHGVFVWFCFAIWFGMIFRQCQDHISKHRPRQIFLSRGTKIAWTAHRGRKSSIKLVAGTVMNFTLAKQNEDSMTEKQNTLGGVWKGFFGIRDLTKIRCGNRENDNILTGSGIWLLPGKRDSPKFGHGMRIFFHLSVGSSGNRPDSNKRSSG